MTQKEKVKEDEATKLEAENEEVNQKIRVILNGWEMRRTSKRGQQEILTKSKTGVEKKMRKKMMWWESPPLGPPKEEKSR